MNEFEVILSGKASFSIEVPYRLYKSNEPEGQPLFVYLQESGLDLSKLEKKIQPLLALSGYHLIIQAPYPKITDHGVEGYQWIPEKQGEQGLTSSREYVSEFLQEVIDNILPHIKASRLVLIGWEASINQLSYFCATRPHYINELILFNGTLNRIWMDENNPEKYKHLRVLGLTGKDAEIKEKVAETINLWIHR
ncbi:hypothetical protein QLX67_00365 [Balneolaceae bacterium ANBcel3]|nr:hypothetical protein [Balneolaceae bacterium ANBcel3]